MKKKTKKQQNKQKRRAHFRMAGVAPPYNVHVGFFHSYLKETKKINNHFLSVSYFIHKYMYVIFAMTSKFAL